MSGCDDRYRAHHKKTPPQHPLRSGITKVRADIDSDQKGFPLKTKQQFTETVAMSQILNITKK